MMSDEYDQSMLYTCMEMSQWNTLLWNTLHYNLLLICDMICCHIKDTFSVYLQDKQVTS